MDNGRSRIWRVRTEQHHEKSEESLADCHVRHGSLEEQRNFGIRSPRQRRYCRQPEHLLQGRPAWWLESDEEAGSDRSWQRWRLLQTGWRREPKRWHFL